MCGLFVSPTLDLSAVKTITHQPSVLL